MTCAPEAGSRRRVCTGRALDPVRWVAWQEQNGYIFAHSFVLARRELRTQIKMALDLFSGRWYEAKKSF